MTVTRALCRIVVCLISAGGFCVPAAAQAPVGLTQALRGHFLEAAGDRAGALAALRDGLAADPESAELRLSLAQMLGQAQKFDEALGLVDDGLARRPGHPQLLLMRARLLDVLGRRDEAASAALEAAAKGAGEEAYGIALRLLQALGRHKEADEVSVKWAESFPGNPDALAFLGQALLRKGDREGARARFTGALEIAPSHRDSLRFLAALEAEDGRDAEALELYRKLAAANPHDGEARLRMAQLLVKLGRGEEALSAMRGGAPSLGDAEATLPLRLALLALQMDRPEEAEKALRPHLDAHPDDTRALYLLGAAVLSQERYQEALGLFEKIPAGAEEYPDALVRRAVALNGLQRGPEAVRLLEGWLAEHPDDEEMALTLAELHSEHGNPRSGVELLEALLSRRPSQNSRFYFSLGALYDKLKDWRKSAETMKRSLELQPDDPQVLNYLGYTYADQGVNLEEAEKLILRALELKPGDGAFVDSLGWVYFRQGRYPEAVRELRRATEISPKDAVIWEHLGDALKASGDRAGALEAYQRSAELDPKAEGVGPKLEELR